MGCSILDSTPQIEKKMWLKLRLFANFIKCNCLIVKLACHLGSGGTVNEQHQFYNIVLPYTMWVAFVEFNFIGTSYMLIVSEKLTALMAVLAYKSGN